MAFPSHLCFCDPRSLHLWTRSPPIDSSLQGQWRSIITHLHQCQNVWQHRRAWDNVSVCLFPRGNVPPCLGSVPCVQNIIQKEETHATNTIMQPLNCMYRAGLKCSSQVVWNKMKFFCIVYLLQAWTRKFFTPHSHNPGRASSPVFGTCILLALSKQFFFRDLHYLCKIAVFPVPLSDRRNEKSWTFP